MVPKRQLDDAETRISELELEISALKTQLAESEAAATESAAEQQTVEAPSSQWHLYGIIVQVRSNTFIVEPLTNQNPQSGSEVRIMKSLGDNRVLHLADGIVLEATPTRAVIRLYAVSSGAEIYGSPEIDDLVYISAVISD